MVTSGQETLPDITPLFIGGCPRSGTTLLASMLADSSRHLVTPESPFKTALWESFEGKQGQLGREEVASFIEGQFRYKLWNLRPMAEFLPPRPLSFSETMLMLVAEFARQQGQTEVTHWIDHTPRNLKHASVLLESFPGAKFIHILRDGRGVASSVMPLDWGPNTPEAAARWWVKRVGEAAIAEEYLRQHGTVVRVRYEELVSRPEQSLADLSSSLFDSDPTEDTGDSVGPTYLPEYTQAQHKLVGKPPDRSRAEAWKKALSAADIEEFERVAGSVLRHLDYNLIRENPESPGSGRRIRRGMVESWRHISNPIRQLLRKRKGLG